MDTVSISSNVRFLLLVLFIYFVMLFYAYECVVHNDLMHVSACSLKPVGVHLFL